jgi:hypothetical protein
MAHVGTSAKNTAKSFSEIYDVHRRQAAPSIDTYRRRHMTDVGNSNAQQRPVTF